MSDFKTRLEAEQSELVDKMVKLSSFMSSEKNKDIASIQKTLLLIQYSAMITYNHCLMERLKGLES